jgi:hypothetical protein
MYSEYRVHYLSFSKSEGSYIYNKGPDVYRIPEVQGIEKTQGGKSEIGFPPSISAPQKASEYQVGTREGNLRIIPPLRNRPEPSSTVDKRVLLEL